MRALAAVRATDGAVVVVTDDAVLVATGRGFGGGDEDAADAA
jgi:hypothetical protein